MARSNGTRARYGRRPEDFGRTSLCGAFVHALRQTRTTQASAARMMGVTALTVRRWLKGESAITAELVANAPRLAAPFARCFAVAMRKQERAERAAKGRTYPRVLRKKGARG